MLSLSKHDDRSCNRSTKTVRRLIHTLGAGRPSAVFRLAACLLILLPVFAGGALTLAPAHAANPHQVLGTARGGVLNAGDFVVPINKSEIIQVDQPFAELLVGNPKIANVLALTDRTIYVLGQAVGTTNLTIYGPNKRLIAVVNLVVSFDVEGLKAKLYEVMPDEKVEVRTVNGTLLLSGLITSAAHINRAMSIAARFAPIDAVTNAMSVVGSQLVALQVRFAEIDRAAERGLGIHFDQLAVKAGQFELAMVTAGGSFIPYATGILNGSAGPFDITAVLQALEKQGVVKTLAEPNLVALSGDTASFLAGGEFPIPVAEDNGSISVSFKNFGVSLAFTPTVVDGDLINLVVAPEVSQIDPALSVKITPGADPVPALVVRRARTTIELRDGQSFAIAGLLQSNYSNSIDQFPWIGNVPVLGVLFRSAGFKRNETELVIIVTVHLVEPATASAMLQAPTDKFVPPNDTELFLSGHIDGQASGGGVTQPPLPDAQSQGGLSGPYGHIIK
jgi:pilus assembly protein CpaC